MTADWTRRPIRFFQHLLREVDAASLDAAQLVAEVRAVGASGSIVMGGGFSAWYPTRLASQTVNPHLKGDFLGDFIEAARRADIKVLVRMDISKGRAGSEQTRPDWYVRRVDGSVATTWAMPQVCATGPFWQNENFAILDEILDWYRPDGFFYNYFHVPRCHCDRCRELVYAAIGEDVPAPEVRSPAYERWRRNFLADYTARTQDFVAARQAAAVVVPYHHVREGWDIRAMAGITGLVSAQISNPAVPNPVDPQPMWNYWAAEEALIARAVTPGRAPILIATTSGFFASRQTAIPPARLVLNLMQAAAHGAGTCPAANGRLVQDDPRCAPALMEIGRFLAANRSWYEGLRPLARIAIVKSEASQLWGPDAGRPAGDPAAGGHLAEFRGLYEMLVALRRPAEILLAGAIDRASLARYDLIILPALSALATGDAAAFDSYVSGGGTLLVTADTGAADEDGAPRQTAPLACLPALPGPHRAIDGAYFELTDGPLKTSLGGIPHIGAAGAFWSPFGRDEGSGDADLRIIGPFANNAPEFATADGPGAEAGLVVRRFGAGRAVWLPWRIGALHHRFAIADYRAIAETICAEAAGLPPIATNAPPAVEFALYEHPEGAVLHALNGAATAQTPFMEPLPLAGFEIRVRTPLAAARRLDADQTCEASHDGDCLTIRLPSLSAFAAFALTAGAAAPTINNPAGANPGDLQRRG